MNTALLLIDIQNDYFPNGRNELVNTIEASEQARKLLSNFRENNRPVIHIQHLSVRPGASFCVPGTNGADIHESVLPGSNEKIITKNFPNSFRETELHQYLQEKQIDDLVIAGMMSHMCVDATVRAARDLGYRITVAQDACATKDLSFENGMIPAKKVHGAFMAALNYFYADIKHSDELIEELQKP